MSAWRLALASLLALAAACPSPSHPAPEYETDPNAPPPTTGAETETAEADEVTPARRAPRFVQQPFLYRVDAGPQPSFLLGTIHVGVSMDAALPAQHLGDLDGARVVLVEIDPSELSARTMMEAAALPSGELDDFFAARDWFELANELDPVIPAQQLKRLRPWFAMSMLVNKRVADMHDGAPPQAMDLTLIEYARERGLPIRPLETPAQQLAAMNAIPNEDMAETVTEMVQDPEGSQRELTNMLDAYFDGDVLRLEQLIFDPQDVAEHPAVYEQLFTRRNAAWLPVLKEELDEGGAFVAVGLGHLIGEGGLIATLRSEGYAIERLR